MIALKKIIERMNNNDKRHIASSLYYDDYEKNKDYLSTAQQKRIKTFIKSANNFGLNKYEAIEIVKDNYLYNNNTLAFAIKHVFAIPYETSEMHGRKLAEILGVYFYYDFQCTLRGLTHTHGDIIVNYTDTNGLDLISFKKLK